MVICELVGSHADQNWPVQKGVAKMYYWDLHLLYIYIHVCVIFVGCLYNDFECLCGYVVDILHGETISL